MRKTGRLLIGFGLIIAILFSRTGLCQTDFLPARSSDNKNLTLVEAVMCERVKDLIPINKAVVFSISVGSVSCFSAFDPVPQKMVIYHLWYKKDRLTTTQALHLEPPRWRTYSKIHLREADKGPWHVEIVGLKGEVLKILRFSVTD